LDRKILRARVPEKIKAHIKSKTFLVTKLKKERETQRSSNSYSAPMERERRTT